MRILVLDPNESHAKAVASALESNRHKLTVCTSRREAFDHLRSKLSQFDIIILDFSNRPEDWELLDKVRSLTVTCVPEPHIRCLSRTMWESDVRSRVERRGAKLLYEQSV